MNCKVISVKRLDSFFYSTDVHIISFHLKKPLLDYFPTCTAWCVRILPPFMCAWQWWCHYSSQDQTHLFQNRHHCHNTKMNLKPDTIYAQHNTDALHRLYHLHYIWFYIYCHSPNSRSDTGLYPGINVPYHTTSYPCRI